MRLAPLLLVAVAGLGCTLARMRPDPALAKATVWPVQVDGSLFSDDSITFGPFRATNINRSWKSSSSSTTGPVTSGSSSQSWSFTLNSLRVECTWRTGETNVSLGGGASIGGKNGENMVCTTIRGNGAHGVISLVHESSGWRGSIEHEGFKLGLHSRHELEGGSTSFDPAGFDALDGAGVFGAIQTVNSPVVWMNAVDQGEQELAAAAFVSVYYLVKVPDRHR